MMKNYILIISTIVLFSTVYGTTDQDCKNVTNPTCSTCLKIDNCAFCTTTKVCFLYQTDTLLSAPCSTSDMQWQTCVGKLITIIFLAALSDI